MLILPMSDITSQQLYEIKKGNTLEIPIRGKQGYINCFWSENNTISFSKEGTSATISCRNKTLNYNFQDKKAKFKIGKKTQQETFSFKISEKKDSVIQSSSFSVILRYIYPDEKQNKPQPVHTKQSDVNLAEMVLPDKILPDKTTIDKIPIEDFLPDDVSSKPTKTDEELSILKALKNEIKNYDFKHKTEWLSNITDSCIKNIYSSPESINNIINTGKNLLSDTEIYLQKIREIKKPSEQKQFISDSLELAGYKIIVSECVDKLSGYVSLKNSPGNNDRQENTGDIIPGNTETDKEDPPWLVIISLGIIILLSLIWIFGLKISRKRKEQNKISTGEEKPTEIIPEGPEPEQIDDNKKRRIKI